MTSLPHLDVEVETGTTYANLGEFKGRVLCRAVFDGSVVRFPVSDTRRVTAKCALEELGCAYEVRALRSLRTGLVRDISFR